MSARPLFAVSLLISSILLLNGTPSEAARASIRANGYEPAAEKSQPRPGGSDAAAPQTSSATASDGVVVIRRGDTLDKLVSSHLGKSPLRPELLRQALMQKNPDLFRQGKTRPLPVGSRLLLPTNEDLRRLLPPELSGMVADDHEAAAVDEGVDPRKGWIRYP